jgi:hypothetical protein
MEFPDRVRLPLSFDPYLLVRDCAAIGREPWTRHFVTQNYDGDWSVVALRAPKGATHPVMMIYSDPAATEFVDTPLLAFTPYVRDVLAALRCPLNAVRLMRLAPGSHIKPHRDHDLDAASGIARIHVPVSTNPQVEFLLNGTRVDMEPGSAWYLRLRDEHSVANLGTSDRVHLVIDARVNTWLEALLGGN